MRLISGQRQCQRMAPAATAAGVVLLPKCPLCLAAMLGAAGVAMPVWAEGPWWMALAGVAICAALLVWAAGKGKASGAAVAAVGLPGAALLAAGRLAGWGDGTAAAGGMLVLVAVLWPRRKTAPLAH